MTRTKRCQTKKKKLTEKAEHFLLAYITIELSDDEILKAKSAFHLCYFNCVRHFQGPQQLVPSICLLQLGELLHFSLCRSSCHSDSSFFFPPPH